MEGTIRRSARLARTRAKSLARFAIVSLCAAASVALVPVTQAAAAPGVTVFVGYADSVRAASEFPNPWAGSPNVTFDGCTPNSGCTFDAGAVRVYNTSTSSVQINQVSVDIATCTYTWGGPLYPVTLAPLTSLVVTQRSPSEAPGCTGPDPASFDSSDIPTEGCTNDGILPTVEVTVDGVTTSSTDSGQVLNSGGVDPGVCANTNESTEWVKIGNKACAGQVLTLAPAAQTLPITTTATVTASFTNSCGDALSGVLVNFQDLSGPNIGLTGTGVTDASGDATFDYSSQLTGTDVLQARITNAAGFVTTSNTADVTWTIEFAPGGGAFVIGDRNAVIGNTVNFWGAQWAKKNRLSGGPAPRSFKGFAEAPATPDCGETWSTDPGNSTPPPAGPLPSLIGVIVTSSSHKQGPAISGDIVEIVVVKTNPGYAPNPGHAATGTVMSVVCGGPAAKTGGAQAPATNPPSTTTNAPAPVAPSTCSVTKPHPTPHHGTGADCARTSRGAARGHLS